MNPIELRTFVIPYTCWMIKRVIAEKTPTLHRRLLYYGPIRRVPVANQTGNSKNRCVCNEAQSISGLPIAPVDTCEYQIGAKHPILG